LEYCAALTAMLLAHLNKEFAPQVSY